MQSRKHSAPPWAERPGPQRFDEAYFRVRLGEIGLEDPERGSLYMGLWSEISETFMVVPGSRNHHHAYKGGLADHCGQVMQLALDLSFLCRLQGGVSFSNGRIIEAAFVHDLDRVVFWQKIASDASPNEWRWVESRFTTCELAVVQLLSQHHIPLDEELLNVIHTTHLGFSDLLRARHDKEACQLAYLIGAADLVSSRLMGWQGSD